MKIVKTIKSFFTTAEPINESGLSFKEYVAAMNALAQKDGCVDSTGIYCDGDNWRDNYDEGLSPEESWEIEKSYFNE